MAALTQTTPSEKTGDGPTILVIEDDPIMTDIVRGALEHAGYRVETAATSSCST